MKPEQSAGGGFAVLDGGLATSLQRVGLPPHTSPAGWLRERPRDVEAAHRAFVDAGAERILTATLRAHAHLEPDSAALVAVAVGVARRAAGGRAEVWGSVGSAARGAWAEADAAVRGQWSAEVGALAGRLVDAGVDGVVLETFVCADEAVDAVRAARARVPGPLVACLTVGPTGALLDGAPLDASLRALLAAGADDVGLNCGFGVGATAAAWRAAPAGLIGWLKPDVAEGELGALTALAAEADGHVRAFGACCGGGPEAVAAVRAARERAASVRGPRV